MRAFLGSLGLGLVGCGPAADPEAPSEPSPAPDDGVLELVHDRDGVRDAAPALDGSAVYWLREDGDLLEGAFREGGGDPVARGRVGDARGLVATVGGLAVAAADGIWEVPPSELPARIEATAGYAAEGVERDGAALVFTAARDGDVGVFRTDGDTVERVAAGPPFVAPSGVVVAPDGRIWVADRAAGRDGRGAVIAVEGGVAEVLADGFEAGTPAGISTLQDGSAILVSAVDDGGHSEVVLVDAETLATRVFAPDEIARNVGSGGLHRVEGADHFAWAGYPASGGGKVYRVDP